MNKKIISFGAIALLMISMMGMLSVTKAVPPAPTIYLEDSYGPGGQYIFDTNTIPAKFNVTVWVKDTAAINIEGWQVYLEFNPNYINVTGFVGPISGPTIRAWPNRDDGSEAWSTSYLFYSKVGTIGGPVFDGTSPTGGAAMGSELLSANVTLPANTPKKLFCVEFVVKQYPPKGQGSQVSCGLTFDPQLTYLYDSNGPIPSGVTLDQTGLYKLSWAVPPAVTPAISPTSIVYGPYPPSAIGQYFDVQVLLKGLNAAWELTTAAITICYNTTVIDTEAANVTIGSGWGPWSITVVHGTPWDQVQIAVTAIGIPSGDVLVATIKFRVMMQRNVPPAPIGAKDTSPIDINDIVLEDHTMEIPTNNPINCLVTINALMTLPTPYFEIKPSSVTLGPLPAVGTEFDVQVKLDNLHYAWYAVAFGFGLHYDQTLLKVVSITEGPFFQNPRWNLYGTWFGGYSDPEPYDVTCGGWLNPNGTTLEWDQTEFPNTVNPPTVNNTVAIIRFQAIKQLAHYDLHDILWVDEFNDHGIMSLLMDKDGNIIPVDETHFINCTYTMLGTPVIGRYIDLYGGADNRGYGTAHGIPFPAPYGGQGPNMPMDLVIPQSIVYLFANVTYNYWPVQSKDVGFEIEGPFDHDTGQPRNSFFIMKYSARSDENGVAAIHFEMPWPCQNPEDLFGVYKVTATVDISGVVVNDTMSYFYYYLIEITKVTTDKYFYAHGEYVKVYIDFKSEAMQTYPVLFSVVLLDELETYVGSNLISTTVGGTTFCHWKSYRVGTYIFIPKWAFAGIGQILVSAFDKDPTVGGAPWCPTYGMGWPIAATVPEIYILPE